MLLAVQIHVRMRSFLEFSLGSHVRCIVGEAGQTHTSVVKAAAGNVALKTSPEGILDFGMVWSLQHENERHVALVNNNAYQYMLHDTALCAAVFRTVAWRRSCMTDTW